jgi:hypothetical protein
MYRVTNAKRWVTLLWGASTQHTPEVSALLSRVEQIPGTKRHPKALDVPYTALDLEDVQTLLHVCLDGDPGRRPTPAALDSAFSDVHRPSFEHQRAAALKAQQALCLLLTDDMGLGKTQSAILAAHNYWKQHGGSWLILAPLFTRATWMADLLACGVIESEDDLCVLEGTKSNAACWRDDAPVYFCHYDIISKWFPRFGFNVPSVVIADEVHNLRNGRAQRSKGAALAMGPAKMRVLLTGTPMENKPSDLWHLLEMTTGKGTWGSPGDFRRRYCGAVQGEWGLEDIGPSNIEELRGRMEPYYLRRTIDDIDQVLPELTRTPVLVDFTGKRREQHAQHFAELDMDELLSAVQGGRSFGEDTLRVLHRLRTLTGQHKLAATAELVGSMVDQGESAVVFCWQRETTQALLTAVSKGRQDAELFKVDGSVPQHLRDGYVKAFQADQAPGVIFATYGALKEGVTLHKARHIVLHDLDWGPSTIAQAEKRIHRIGQRRSCTSHWMLCDDSIDTLFATILAAKMRNNAEVLEIDYGFGDMLRTVAQHAPELPEMAQQALEQWREW